ncbi:MAG: DNA cytosine methyltransferase [Microscillaceae bacterium]|nr:DNA cytosine methyltransferase [Microscillaceae bacterium]
MLLVNRLAISGKELVSKIKKNGDLFLEFVRIVKGLNPEAFVFENVVGITQSKHSGVIKYMLDQFSGMGFGLSYNILNAADYGVPQRRERFFLMGIRNVEMPAFPFPTHFKDEKAWNGFNKNFDEVPSDSRYTDWLTVKDALNKIPQDYRDRKDYVLMNCSAKVVHRMTFIEQGKNFKVLPPELLPDCWKSGKHQGQDTFGRLVADLPSVTIRTAAYNPAKGMYIHPFENRGLDSIEMAALQDFPLDWRFKCANRDNITLVSAGKQIGNAVPPSLAKAIGLALRMQLGV